MVNEDFSKSFENIALESFGYIKEDKNIHEVQLRSIDSLKGQPKRESCILCQISLNNEILFCHRSISYIKCRNCGHIQTQEITPVDYPYAQNSHTNFDKIYPPLEDMAYLSRRRRIYDPKLEWALKHLKSLNLGEDIFKSSWLELGSGAGYFLSALKEQGFNNITGIEKNNSLTNLSNSKMGNHTICYKGELADVFLNYQADIYVAFFVLEHIENPYELWENIAKLPKNTVFIFSVPMFGFATLLESAFVDYAARNLDNAVHTQLYTDESIHFALENSGYEKIAQWTFGQDAHDLVRLLFLKLENIYSKEILQDVQEKLIKTIDPLQTILDRNYLADARHVLAIKR